jgi:hypothetical protein
MCETRRGVVTVPNTVDAYASRALAEARKDAAARVADNELIIGESFRLDGSGSPRWDDSSLMEFHYVYTVMVPGCAGWSRPLT